MYFNVATQVVTAAPASSSFSTSTVFQNADGGMYHVAWASFASTGAYFELKGSGNNGSNYKTLVNNAGTTMVVTVNSVGAGDAIFDVEYFGGTNLQIVYTANGTTGAGTIDVHRTLKGRR